MAIQPSDKALIKELRQNWKYDSIEGHYTSNEKFLQKFYKDSVYNLSIVGRDTSFVIKHFGKHFSIVKGVGLFRGGYATAIRYSLSKPCAGDGTHCMFLTFAYWFGKVVEVQYIDMYPHRIDDN